MAKKYLKFICIFTAVIVAFSCFGSVSAVQVGDSTIIGTKGVLWNLYGNNQRYNAVVSNYDDTIFYNYSVGSNCGSPVATYSYCSFSGPNYGTLKLTYVHDTAEGGAGSVYYDSFNGLYNEKEEKIASFKVTDINTYQLVYTGYIPSEFSVRAYWSVAANNHASIILNISFNSSNENISNEIKENQDKNTDKILDGDEDIDSSKDTGKVSGSINNVDDAKDGALGGKSDKEIQKEINSALDSDKIGLDFNKAAKISNFFDNLLNAFGKDYKTLLMLSLCLGLAGFLIGRRWA